MTDTTTEPRLYTYAEAAALLTVKVPTLQKLVQERQIPHKRLGRLVRFSDADLQAFIDGHHQPAEPLRRPATPQQATPQGNKRRAG